MQNIRLVFNLGNSYRDMGVIATNTRHDYVKGVRDSIQPNPLLDLINFLVHSLGGSRVNKKRQVEGSEIYYTSFWKRSEIDNIVEGI